MKALLVGGTGPTGPHLVQGLVDRGYEVALFHRGTHEIDDLPPVEHIHGDPHFRETIDEALGGRSFDLVLATYGRIRHLADALAGRCDRFISVGGLPLYRGFLRPETQHPYGMKVLAKEDEGLSTEPDPESQAGQFSHLIWATERHIFAQADRGAFRATHFRYPLIYGPRQNVPIEWLVVKRILDGRPYIIVPDGGLSIVGRAAARNAAHCVLLAVDRPEASAGQTYNVADDDQYTQRQWIELIAEAVGRGPLAIASLPDDLAVPARPLFPLDAPIAHSLVDSAKARAELGYRDALPAREALRETVAWLLENPVTPEEYPHLRDRFDYDAEDRLVTAYREAVDRIRRDHPFEIGETRHSYAHPKQAGQQRDHRGR